LEHAIDIKAINECATRDDGAYGMDLLRHSINRTSEVSGCCFYRLHTINL
jgi:hypothetical protein